MPRSIPSSSTPSHHRRLGARAVRVATTAAALTMAMPLTIAGAAPAAAPSLSGYVQKSSPRVVVPAGTRVQAEVTCPRPLKVVGGGAAIDSSSLDLAIQYSAPVFDGTRWVARVTNSGTADGSFRVNAVCVSGIKNYSYIEGIGADNPPATQARSSAFCPSGTVPLGGGGNALSPTISSSVDDSRPLANGWTATTSNPGPDDNFVLAYVVCGQRPAGWRQVAGTPVTLKPESQGQAAAACPKGTKVLSGGEKSSSSSPSVALNSSAPSSERIWQTFHNNAASISTKVIAYATCAAASS